MADFCKQCSFEIFDADYKELAGMVSVKDFAEGKAAYTMCEGCGPIFVGPDGSCVDPQCSKHSVSKEKVQVRYCEPEEVWSDPDFVKYCNGEIERKPEWGTTYIDLPPYNELIDPINKGKIYKDGKWINKVKPKE